MEILLKTSSAHVSSIQIMQVRVQTKGKSVWKSRYDGDVSGSTSDHGRQSTRHDRRWFGRLEQEDQRLKKHYGRWMNIVGNWS